MSGGPPVHLKKAASLFGKPVALGKVSFSGRIRKVESLRYILLFR